LRQLSASPSSSAKRALHLRVAAGDPAQNVYRKKFYEPSAVVRWIPEAARKRARSFEDDVKSTVAEQLLFAEVAE
jgi:hypothetical protein